MMEYKEIPYVNKPVSRIVMGCANSIMLTKPKLFRQGPVTKLLDTALEQGINTFDTAENYGYSETLLGQWMSKRKNREEVVILSKGCHPYNGVSRVNTKCLISDLDQSLRRLRTDYIDIYLLHRDNTSVEVGEIVEVLNEQHKAGKIGAFGGSNWTHTRIKQANDYAQSHGLVPFTVSSPNFGLATQIESPFGEGCVSISGEGEKDARDWYRDNNISIFAFSSLGRGLFSGKIRSANPEEGKNLLDKFAIRGYWCEENLRKLSIVEEIAKRNQCTVSQLALRYVLEQGFSTFSVVSMSNPARIPENVECLNISLAKEDKDLLLSL